MDRPIVGAVVLFGLIILMPDQGEGIFLCKDTEGRQVLTDRPAQLKDCTKVDTSTPPASGSRPPSPSPPAVPHERADDKSPPNHQPKALVVPLQRAGNLFLVTVHLVGEAGETDARLIVDTGASHTIVSHKLALALSLYSDSTLGTVTMNTVGGPVQAPLSRLKSIQLKEAEVTNSLVVIHDLPDSPDGVEGLLGLSVLQHFQVTLDPGRSVLSLQPFPK